MNIAKSVEPQAVPFSAIVNALRNLEYGSLLRVGLELLLLTGARISELDNMTISCIFGNRLIWKVGKNQRGAMREAFLPTSFLRELNTLRKNHRCDQHLLPVNHDTFRRYFNKNRHRLGQEWLEKHLMPKRDRIGVEYVLQVKGLRKLHSTATFVREFEKWKSAEVALEMTSKEMKHNSNHMTAYHYLREDWDRLGIRAYLRTDPENLVKENTQRRLADFI